MLKTSSITSLVSLAKSLKLSVYVTFSFCVLPSEFKIQVITTELLFFSGHGPLVDSCSAFLETNLVVSFTNHSIGVTIIFDLNTRSSIQKLGSVIEVTTFF